VQLQCRIVKTFLQLGPFFFKIAGMEDILMKTGQLVKAETFSDGDVFRKVVEVKGETVYLCTETEWDLARKTKQEPLCVGFNKRYIKASSDTA